ncbi:hypothetical protein EDM53_02860 [Rickettsiales endosymbiont of Peranema trichophorum]|uniref:sodium:solute symporter family transporter n=1 Tax=Rickettsiales endosymbiont of Peranema trichophorum TaxID=2486577 RepID=UPI001023BC86|nr:ATP-binding protein [Rickettsiales endosymbiont of Peranema trichophorum]RZI47290.1 hypothetical protein EDM53_02860 [Rickettsiales endosymbiont of Peranema trichophorum]
MVERISTIDTFIVICYFVGCLAVAFWKSHRIKTIREYTLGSGSVSTTVLVCTIFATAIGAGSTIGTVSEVYRLGLLSIVACCFLPGFWLISCYIFSDIRQFKGCLSVSDIMSVLYGEPGRWVTNICAIIFSVGIVGAQAMVVANILDYFFHVGPFVGAIIGVGVLTFYSAFGGIRAVALTDVFQFFIFYIAIPLAFATALHELGGFSTMWSKLPESHAVLDLSGDNLYVFLGLLVFILRPETAGTSIQRFLMSGNPLQLRKALLIVSMITIPLTIIISFIGVIMKLKEPDLAPDDAFIAFIAHHLSDGVKGFMIAAITAVIMSTADSWLNTTSVLVAHDICKRIWSKMSDRTELTIARLATFVIGAMSVSVTLMGKGLIEVLFAIINFWSPLVDVQIAAGFLKFRTNSLSYICSVVLGSIGVSVAAYFKGEFGTLSLSAGLIGSTVGLFGSHFLQLCLAVSMPRREQRLKEKAEEMKLRHKRFSITGVFVSLIRNMRLSNLLKLAKQHTSNYKPRYELSGIGMVLCLSVAFLADSKISFVTYNIISLKLILGYGIASLLVCFQEELPHKWKTNYLPLYWYATMLFAFPVTSIHMLLLTHGSIFWGVHLVVSTFIMSVFLDYGAFMTLSLLGMLIGGGLAYILPPLESVHALSIESVYGLGVAMVGFIAISIVKRMQDATLGKVELVNSRIVHELRSPLSVVMSASEFLDTIMADAILRAKDKPVALTNDEIDKIKELCDAIKDTSARGLNTVSVFLARVRQEPEDNGKYLMRKCITSVLSEYKVDQKLYERIDFQGGEDFTFEGSWLLVKNVIFNIVENALKYSGEDVKVEIRTENNRLHIKDYGKGIPDTILPRIFDEAYSGEVGGTGLGLALCKEIIEELGGGIYCMSEVGHYTEFVLVFPRVR